MISRDQFEFGSGHVFCKIAPEKGQPAHAFHELLDTKPDELAKILGWADGCPVVLELSDQTNTEPGRGPQAMVERYGEINFWFGHITRTAEVLNPNLYDQLVTPVQRKITSEAERRLLSPTEVVHEPVGRKYEPESIPETHYTEMSPLSTLPGFALPRLFIEQLGRQANSIAETQTRFQRADDALEVALANSSTPAELLASFAEAVCKMDVDPVKALAKCLGKGWLDEQGALSMMVAQKRAMRALAPSLMAVYDSMDAHTKHRLEIV